MKRLLLLLTLGMLPVMASAQGMFPRNLSLSANTSLSTTHQDRLLLLDCTGGKTFTLPDATTYGVVGDASSSHMFVMKRISATGTCTIATTSSQTIDGAAPPSLTVQNQELWVVSVGTSDWRTIAKVREACADLADAGTGCTSTATSGTVTSVATAGVVTGGTITNTGTIGILNQGSTTTVLHGNAAGQAAFSATVSADLNITTTSCTNQFVTAISAGAVGTCTTATLASAQFANQGTTTTVLHGNAGGNPSFGAVANADLANPSTTVNSVTCTLGSPCTITATPTAFPSAVTGEPLTTNSSGTLVQTGSYLFVDQFAGADIGAQINACIAALALDVNSVRTGTCVLPVANNTTWSTAVTYTGYGLSLIGQGPNASVFNCTRNGDCIRMTAAAYLSRDNANMIQGFTLNGNSGASAVGLHAGDMVGLILRDLVFQGFTGANSAGYWFDNTVVNAFTERFILQNLNGANNTISYRFTDTAGPPNGFDFSYWDVQNIKCNISTGQDCVTFENDVQTIYWKNFSLNANVNSGSGAIVHLKNTAIFNGDFTIRAENTSGATPTCITADAGTSFSGWGSVNCNTLANTGAGAVVLNGSKSFNTDLGSLQLFAGTTQITGGVGFNYANPSLDLVFSRNNLLTTFQNKIQNSFSGTAASSTMAFWINDGTASGFVNALVLGGNNRVGIGPIVVAGAPATTLEVGGVITGDSTINAVSGFQINGVSINTTQAAGDNTTALATDAFVQTAISNATAGYLTPLAPVGFPAIRTQSGASLMNDSLLASDATTALLPPCSVLRRSRCRTRTF